MDTAALQQLGSTVVDWRFKGLPPRYEGRTVAELTAARADLFADGFTTPVLTLDSEALRHNLELMARWTAEHDLAFAPHGKTPMAPQLFERQLALGAWGITAAMPVHVRMYRAFGVQRIFLANQLLDPAALAWLSAELDADPSFRFVCYVDSLRGIELMEDALQQAGAQRRVDVVVELGADGARTGARGVEQALELAAASAASQRLRLVGAAGYEGTISVADDSRGEVVRWLAQLVELARRADAAGHFADADEIIVSAGGSEHFDLVAAALTAEALPLGRPVLRLLRSGAYITHDHLHYARITPLKSAAPQQQLRPALRLWAQVVSRPEPGLALLNAGKRDLPYDLGMPVPTLVRTADGEFREAKGLGVTKLADQHAFVAVEPGAELAVGDWVALGLSHPCTAFEKWQLIPEVQADGTVVDYIRTFF
ncbi:amino acid deaminase [Streptacidiphilus sp. PB12-B1b]|uniref:alanine racemase n=1 Tax=Streptacidiphilus sp. PB12-B1b TaxID=2705012 RepID=UPI0015FB581B|nr:alanine racemase [Streptacidiphilus sp. PB12-B1b]QMU75134.1 amino acid deaminase [Streptacidiphilus sp. PB12-B1b]